MNREEGKRRQNPFLADGVNRNAANNGVTEKFHAVRGHGFAAERANHLYDSVLPGSSAELVGDNNAKDGADRIVGGIQIQSKYCASGAKCVRECFRDGKFRYYADGKPMQIEVPSDLYEDAVRAMESRIEKGEVAGISDPKQARSIIRRGHITYAQARNIAKAGTIESLTYDATTGAISALPGASVTGVVSFWNACESGCAPKEAVLIAAKSVGGVVGKNAAINLAASQATKLGLNAALRPAAKTVVEAVGFKGASLLATAANGGSKVLTGAAAQSAATKFLTSNAVTGAATTVILSASDLVDVFRGRMSTGEFAKNLTHTVGGVAGGVVGAAAAGAATGSVIPGAGTAVGGVIGFIGGTIGNILGSSGARTLTSALSDEEFEPETVDVMDVLEGAFKHKGQEYRLTRDEADAVAIALQQRMTSAFIDNLIRCRLPHSKANALMDELIAPIIQRRTQTAVTGYDSSSQGQEESMMFGKKREQELPTSDEMLQEVIARIQHDAAQNKMTEEEAADHLEAADIVVNGIMKPFFDLAHGRDVEEIAREVQARQAEYEERSERLVARENAQQNPPQRNAGGGEMDLLRKFIGS